MKSTYCQKSSTNKENCFSRPFLLLIGKSGPVESFSPESARFYRKTSAKCLQYILTSSHFPSVLAVTFVKPLSSFTTRNFKRVFLQVCCGLVQSEPICDQTEFLHANGTCVACPACVPGEELSEVAHTLLLKLLLVF